MRPAGTWFLAAIFLFLPGAAFANGNTGGGEANGETVLRLTKENIAGFLQEMRTVSMGERTDMLPGEIDAWLQRHLSADGSFRSKTTFILPGYPEQAAEMKIGRAGFIDNVIGGKNLILDYETALTVKEIKIAGNGKSASVTTASADSGKMPWPGDDGSEKMIPIQGASECTQKIALSPADYIEITDAECVTSIRFLPFDKPLGE